MRRPNCALSNAASSFCSSSGVFALNSDAFTTSTSQQPSNEQRAQRQFRRSEAERVAGFLLVYTVHLVQHRARLDLRDPELGIALAITHSYFSGLLRYRLVRKDADPNPSPALDRTRH